MSEVTQHWLWWQAIEGIFWGVVLVAIAVGLAKCARWLWRAESEEFGDDVMLRLIATLVGLASLGVVIGSLSWFMQAAKVVVVPDVVVAEKVNCPR